MWISYSKDPTVLLLKKKKQAWNPQKITTRIKFVSYHICFFIRLLKLLLKVCDLFSELNESWNALHHHPSMVVALGLKILTHTLPAKKAKIRARSEPKLRWSPHLAVQCLYVDKIFCKLFCKYIRYPCQGRV